MRRFVPVIMAGHVPGHASLLAAVRSVSDTTRFLEPVITVPASRSQDTFGALDGKAASATWVVIPDGCCMTAAATAGVLVTQAGYGPGTPVALMSDCIDRTAFPNYAREISHAWPMVGTGTAVRFCDPDGVGHDMTEDCLVASDVFIEAISRSCPAMLEWANRAYMARQSEMNMVFMDHIDMVGVAPGKNPASILVEAAVKVADEFHRKTPLALYSPWQTPRIPYPDFYGEFVARH